MIGYNFNQKHLPLEFAGTCLHCSNESKVRYMIPADVGIILRTGKASFNACDRCWDDEAKEFKLGYRMGLQSKGNFKKILHDWLELRKDEVLPPDCDPI